VHQKPRATVIAKIVGLAKILLRRADFSLPWRQRLMKMMYTRFARAAPGVTALGRQGSASIYAIDGNTAGTSGEITPFDTITIAVSAGGDALNVIPTPALTLNNGATATYVSGAGTDELLFVYTPSSGDDIATLGVTAQSGLIIDDTNGGSYLTVAPTVFPNVNVDTTPPSLTLTGTSADALQGGAPVTAASSATITDPNGDGTLNGATISIANRQPGDTLGIAGATSGA
jgi:hypothetical protein